MKLTKLLQAAVCISAVAASSYSYAAGCAKPRTAFDNVYCAGNLYSQVDKDLNTSYGELRKMLNANQQASLKQGQLAWIRERNDSCSESRGNSFMIDLDCAVSTTQSRLDFLNERLRECKSTGCESTKLGR